MQIKNSNNGKVAAALILGAAIGAALGLLLAPEKGSDTRRKLSKAAKNLTGRKNEFSSDTNGFEDPESDRPV